jgi:hypothetical protein
MGFSAPRGFEFEITPELIQATQDRWGNSPYDDLSDDEQRRKWQKVFLQPGTVDEGLARTLEAERLAAVEKERLAKRALYARHGRSVPLDEDEILKAAAAIEARRDAVSRG